MRHLSVAGVGVTRVSAVAVGGGAVGAPVDADARLVPLVATSVSIAVGTPRDELRSRHSGVVVVQASMKLEVTRRAFLLVAGLEAKVVAPVTVAVAEDCDFGASVVRIRACRDEPYAARLE